MKISSINLLPQNTASKPFLKSSNPYLYGNLKPLPCDTVTFTSLNEPLQYKYVRDGIYANHYFNQKEWSSEVLTNIPVLRNNNTFGLKEYKQLSGVEKKYLREVNNRTYFTEDVDGKIINWSVNEDKNNILALYD